MSEATRMNVPTALGEYVVVQEIKKDKTQGGVYVPDRTIGLIEARVVNKGDEVTLDVTPEDVVVVKYLDDKHGDYAYVHQNDIRAKL